MRRSEVVQRGGEIHYGKTPSDLGCICAPTIQGLALEVLIHHTYIAEGILCRVANRWETVAHHSNCGYLHIRRVIESIVSRTLPTIYKYIYHIASVPKVATGMAEGAMTLSETRGCINLSIDIMAADSLE